MSTSLASMQAALAQLLRGGGSLVDDPEATRFAEELATGNERLSPVGQLDLYREQFVIRHVDVLREDFRSLEHLLGVTGFQRLARTYLAAHPPSSYTLRDLGHAMASHVASVAPWSQDPLLADLARVEWAFVEAFDAADAPPLDREAMAALPEAAWPEVRIVLHPSVQRLALAHRAHDYRLAVRGGTPPPQHVERPVPAPSYLVIHRGPEHLEAVDLSPDAYRLLEALADGARLGEACERVAVTAQHSLEDELGGWFEEWTKRGWFSRVGAD